MRARRISILLSCFLIAYTAVAVGFETWFTGDGEIEQLLCRFHVCSNAVQLQGAREQLWEAQAGAAERSIPAFQEALRRNPASSYRWSDLGEAYLRAGKLPSARHCFERAVSLGPHSPPILLRAGNFYFQVGEPRPALRLMAHILDQIREYDALLFSTYSAMVDDVAEVLGSGIPDNREAVESYSRYLLRRGSASDLSVAWDWVVQRGLADDTLFSAYLNFLVRHRLYEAAVETLEEYAGERMKERESGERVFNPGFEFAPLGAVLDWRVRPSRHVEVARDGAVFKSGSRSLRLRFQGTENLAYRHLSQKVIVEPGKYRFRAQFRSEAITTDQGVAFRVFDAERPSTFDIRTEQMVGTADWKKVEKTFSVPRATRLIEIQLVRKASWKFDSKIAGTVWIDEISLKKLPIFAK